MINALRFVENNGTCDYCEDPIAAHTPGQVDACALDLYEQLHGPRMTQGRNSDGPGARSSGAENAEAFLLRRGVAASTSTRVVAGPS